MNNIIAEKFFKALLKQIKAHDSLNSAIIEAKNVPNLQINIEMKGSPMSSSDNIILSLDDLVRTCNICQEFKNQDSKINYGNIKELRYIDGVDIKISNGEDVNIDFPNYDFKNLSKSLSEDGSSLLYYAFLFTFCHELGHMSLKHEFTDDDIEQCKKEVEADTFAFDLILKDNEQEKVRNIGTIIGIVSPLFLDGYTDEPSHPSIIDRVDTYLNRIGYDVDDETWKIMVTLLVQGYKVDRAELDTDFIGKDTYLNLRENINKQL